jgi:hypothetical protein
MYVPLILKVLDIIFWSGAKNIMGHFAGFFEGLDLFDPKIALRYAHDNFKVKAPSKNPAKCPIICLAREKK